MARYKEFEKDGRQASLRMHGWIDYEDNNRVFTTYEIIFDWGADYEKRVDFGENPQEAIDYLKKLGYKEW